MSTTVAKALVALLERAGVKRCYGIPGDTLNYVTDAIRASSIRWVHVRHEEAAGFAAGADALLSGQLSVCAGSCGPGSLHFINGLFESHRNGAPVLLLASQVDSRVLDTQFPQEVDFAGIYEQCSVYCSAILSADEVYTKTVQAIRCAYEKQGVAVLILPVNISMQPAPKQALPDITVAEPPVIQPSADVLQRMADAINKSKKITIFGGYGCRDAREELFALAEKLHAPIVRTSRAKDFLEHDNPYDCGMTGLMGHSSGCLALESCDTALLLGTNFAWPQYYPQKATRIQVDREASHVGKRCPVHIAAVGTVQDTLRALLPLVQAKDDHSFLAQCRKEYTHSLQQYNKHTEVESSGRIHPQYLASLINKAAAPDAIFSADGGSPIIWLLRYIESTGKRRGLTSLLHGTMANALPQALGAQAAYPGRQVIAMSGDGGLAMLLGDLLTAIQEQLPIKIVVFNNSSLFFVEMEQRVEGLLDAFTDLHNPNFGNVASAMGIWGKQVSDCRALAPAVTEWLAQPGPALLDVIVTKELVMPPKIQLAQANGLALYSAKAILDGQIDEVVTMIKENI